MLVVSRETFSSSERRAVNKSCVPSYYKVCGIGSMEPLAGPKSWSQNVIKTGMCQMVERKAIKYNGFVMIGLSHQKKRFLHMNVFILTICVQIQCAFDKLLKHDFPLTHKLSIVLLGY